SRDGESLESYYSRFYKMMNELVRNQCDVTNHQVNVQFLLQLKPEWQRFVTLVKQSQELKTVSYHKLYDILKQHQNEVNELTDERLARTTNPLALVAQQQPQADWRDDANDESKDQELEAHYMYMAQIQEVTPDAATDFGPIFDTEPLQKVSNNDHYNVFAIESEHPEQSKSVHDTYPIEKDEHNVIIDSLDMSYKEQLDQDNDDDDLANKRELLVSLIEKLKCEIDDSKNHNKFLETSNKVLVDKLKAPESDEVIHLEKESRSKLSELIRPFDYEKLNNLYDLFVPQREKSSEQRYFSKRDPFIQNTIEANFCPEIRRINANLEKFHLCLKEKMVADLRYFNSLELEVDSLKSQLETQKTLFLNEIDRLSREYYYADHMNAILGVYTELDEVTNLQCTVKFGNDQIAPILGYEDLVQGAVTIKRVYYVEGMNHNLLFVGQFCDADLEVAFRKSTCYIRDLKGNDLLTGSHGTDLYSITLQDTTFPNPICLMAKSTSSQAWLWHRRLSHLNFNTINLLSKNDIVIGLPKLKFVKDHLCSSCELGKAKQKSFQIKTTPSLKRRLQLLHMDLCGPMRVASINGKKYVLVIIDDYSRYTWTHFLRSKDETPEVLIDFLRLVQRGFHAQVRIVRTDKGIKFLNKTLHAYFAYEGILHQTSVARTPGQNGVVERQNRTLVEAARTMLSTAKVPLFFWAEAIATKKTSARIKWRDMYVELFFVRNEYQLADLFTKALPEERFKYLVRLLGMRCLTPEELEVLANESA
nr:retrovirus-related Pol polyprotein from transposon TNT 1-94 [Tanacetum cinerariifolium]